MIDHKTILDKHDIIFWDFDETLVNGVNSELYQNYIKDNSHKTHYIITFRTKYQSLPIYDILNMDKVIGKENINGLFSAPESIYMSKMMLPELFQQLDHKKKNLKNEISDNLIRYNISWEEFYEAYDIICRWKPTICSKYGKTILVDDLDYMVEDDCNRLGIEYLNSSKKSI